MLKPDYTILLVDDDRIYSQSVVESAFDEYAICIVHYEDWESALTQLKGNPDKFHAIILDAKGKLTQDDSSENMSHIITVLQDIKELEGHGLYYPYVINTGYIDDSVLGLLKQVKIFAKGKEDSMLKYLIDQIKCSPYDRLRKKNEVVFYLFDDVQLPVQSGRMLLDVLIFADSPSWGRVVEDFFTPVRKILERVFWKLKELGKIDNRCFNGERINLKACIDYIEGNTVRIDRLNFTGGRITPSHISVSLEYIYNMTGTFSHTYKGEADVSPYALQSVAMSLCEVLYWFKSYIENLEIN
jgi:hypothetical protein